MKQRTRKLSILVKILLPASLLIILICLALGMSAYQSINKGMVSMGVEQAKMAAQIAVDVVDADLVAALEPGCEDTEGYQTLLAELREVQERYGILYLYTVYTDGKQVYYGVDTDTSELQAYVGKPFEKTYEQLAPTFAGQDTVQEYIDYSEYGDVISVYKPIKNSAGEVVAVLGSDYDASNIVSELNSSTRQVIVMAIIDVIIAIVLFSIIVGNITKGLRKVNQKVYDLVHSEGDLPQKLDVRSGDELELIADNVNKLLEHIRGIMINIAGNSVQLNNSSKTVVSNLSSAEVNITDVSATTAKPFPASPARAAAILAFNASRFVCSVILMIFVVNVLISSTALDFSIF